HLRRPDPLRQARHAHLLERGGQQTQHHEPEIVAAVAREVRVGDSSDEARQEHRRRDRQPDAQQSDDERRPVAAQRRQLAPDERPHDPAKPPQVVHSPNSASMRSGGASAYNRPPSRNRTRSAIAFASVGSLLHTIAVRPVLRITSSRKNARRSRAPRGSSPSVGSSSSSTSGSASSPRARASRWRMPREYSR